MAKPECSKCGALKEGSYKKESWCGNCIRTRRAELRKERRLEKGLPPLGSGRDPKCKKCGVIKGPSYQDSPWCGPCKCASEKVRYEAKKAAKTIQEGKLPETRRVGRNPICKCGNKKDHPESGYCSECNARRKREYRLRKKTDTEWVNKERERNISRFRDNIENQIKQACRRATHAAQRKGILKRQPCEVCGTTEMIEAHHDDYSKPLEVRWLCSRHHHDHHMNIDKEIRKCL